MLDMDYPATTFGEAVNKYHNSGAPDHLKRNMAQMFEAMRQLKHKNPSWPQESDRESPQYEVFYHLLELYYFLEELEEQVPLAHDMIKKCYKVWSEEPYNPRMVEDMMADIWD